MEITIQGVETTKAERGVWCDDYTIYVGDHRILTVSTDSPKMARKWLNDVYNKSRCSNTKHGILIVGMSAERYSERVQSARYFNDIKESDCSYNLIKLCVGAHCLIYELPEAMDFRCYKFVGYNHEQKILKAFNDLLTSTNVVTVGIKMTSLAKDLQRLNGISISNPVDLNVMAAKVMPVTEEIDLGRCYDLDRLAKAVLGKKMDVTRPQPPAYRYRWDISDEEVKIGTLDTYLAFLIAYKLLDLTNGSVPADASSFTEKKKPKKKKKKNKSKSNHD